MSKIRAGKLRNLVTIQQPNSGNDAYGAPLGTFSTWKTVWAAVRFVSGSEGYKGQQFSPEVTHEVEMRCIDGVTPFHRILTSDGMILDILYANYPERKLDGNLILVCKQRLGVAGDVEAN